MKIIYDDVEVVDGNFTNEVRIEQCESYCIMEDIEFDPSKIRLVPSNEREISQLVEEHIYSYYPEKKQTQDEKWLNMYTNKLKALGINDLEKQILSMSESYFNGTSLDEALVDIESTQKYMFEKLLKISIRTQWLELSIKEGLKAIEEDRSANYPEFPIL